MGVNRGALRRPFKQRNPQANSCEGLNRYDEPPLPPSNGDEPDRGSQTWNGSRAEKESSCDSAAVRQGEVVHVCHSVESDV